MKRFDFNNGPDADEHPLIEAQDGRYVHYSAYVQDVDERLEKAAVLCEGSEDTMSVATYAPDEIRALKVVVK